MSQINQAVEKREVEYVAFLSQEKIRLTIGMVRQYIAVPAFDKEKKEQVFISDAEAMRFLMLCRARQLNPWEGDAFAVPFWDARAGVHKWSLITAHNAFLKRAEANKEFVGMESGVMVETDGAIKELEGDFVPDTLDGEKVRLVGGWAKVHRTDRKFPTTKKAKLSTYQQSFGRWMSDAAGMIVKVAEADALRSSFPNTLGGMYLREEQAVDVDAAVQVAEERRPDFGQQKQVTNGTTPQAKKEQAKVADKQPAKTPQEPAGAVTPAASQSEAQSPGNEAQQAASVPVATTQIPAPASETTREAAPQGQGEGEGEDLSGPVPSPEPEAAKAEPTQFVPDPKDTDAVSGVKQYCHQSGITVEQLLKWARAKKISKEGQHLHELAESKLTNICAQWNNILPVIKQVNQLQ